MECNCCYDKQARTKKNRRKGGWKEERKEGRGKGKKEFKKEKFGTMMQGLETKMLPVDVGSVKDLISQK